LIIDRWQADGIYLAVSSLDVSPFLLNWVDIIAVGRLILHSYNGMSVESSGLVVGGVDIVVIMGEEASVALF
jgi:hypothetical protein